MSPWLLVVFLGLPSPSEEMRSDFRTPRPGEASAAALELLDEGRHDSACAALVDLLRAGTSDPWSFRGAALCAADHPPAREEILLTLDELSESSPHVLFARGLLSWLEGDLEESEQLLRVAVDQAPDFALAWSTLGTLMLDQGDALAAVGSIEHALTLSPRLQGAQENLERAQLYVSVFDRLVVLLETIPQRWGSLPKPRIPMSGAQSWEVLSSSSPSEIRAAVTSLSVFALAPLDRRQELFRRQFEENPPTELDLWIPGFLVERDRPRNLDDAALLTEAWLQRASDFGRRDALLIAAATGIEIARARMGSERLSPVIRRWAAVPTRKGMERGRARLGLVEGADLSFRGRTEEALEAFRRARTVFRKDKHRQGEGAALVGVADCLSVLGENEAALESYNSARRLFRDLGSQLGEANALLGQSQLLFILGESESALEGYRNARTLYQTIGYLQGEAHALEGEAGVLLLWGRNAEALENYRTARSLLQSAGSEQQVGSTYQGEAEVLSRQGENRNALDLYRMAKSLSRATGDRAGEANALRGEGDILFRLGEITEALEAFRQAKELAREAGSLLVEGHALDGEGYAHFQMGETEAALEAYTRAENLYRAEGHQLGMANALLGVARVRFRMGDIGPSLEAYEQAREIFKSIGDWVGEANTLLGEASILARWGRLQEALVTYRKAGEMFHSVGETLGEGNSLDGEALIQFQLGEIEGALSLTRRARSLFRDAGFLAEEGGTFALEAEILSHLKAEGELEAYRKARVIFRQIGDRVGEAETLVGEARILLTDLEDVEGARALLRSARTLFRSAGARRGEGAALNAEADLLLLNLGKTEESLQAYRLARELFRAVEDQVGEGNTFLGEAVALFESLDFKGAAEAARTAVDLFRGQAEGPNLIMALGVEGLARHRKAVRGPNLAGLFGPRVLEPEAMMDLVLESQDHRRQRELDAAERLAHQAIQLFAIYRQGFVAEEHRTLLEQLIAPVYDLLITTLENRSGDLDQALSLAEEARSRVLLDLLTAGSLGGTEAPLDFHREAERLLAELARIEDRLQDGKDLADHHRLLTRRSRLDADLMNNLYRRIVAEQRDQVFSEPLDASAIRSLADEVGWVLVYYVAELELIAFWVSPSPGRMQVHSTNYERVQLTDLVETFLYELSNPAKEVQAASRARELWDLLIAPFAEALPEAGPIMLVPHGPLHGLPFEALVDPKTGERLFERWDVTVTPSVSALAFARQRHRTAALEDTFVAFAAGVGLGLPQEDVRAVADFFPASQQRIFAPEAAEYRFYEELASQADHLLIATHGVHSQASRRGTYLQIRPTPGVHDSRLTAAEIAAIPIEAELVTLAACDTDRDDALLSDERLTLTRSFLIAGAASVLATRWRLPDDRRATRFLVDFYRAYREGGEDGGGLRKDQALSEARRLAIQRGDPAQIWAAWVLVGDGR